MLQAVKARLLEWTAAQPIEPCIPDEDEEPSIPDEDERKQDHSYPSEEPCIPDGKRGPLLCCCLVEQASSKGATRLVTTFLALSRAAARSQEPSQVNVMQHPALRVEEPLEDPHAGAEGNSARGDLSNLAKFLEEQGDLKGAERLYRMVLGMRPQGEPTEAEAEDMETIVSMNFLAHVLHSQSKVVEAEALFRRALEMTSNALGSNHVDTWAIMVNLGHILREQKQYNEAEFLFRRALAGFQKELEGHPNTATTMSHLAALLEEMGQLEEAEGCYVKAALLFEACYGPRHLKTLMNMLDVASLRERMGKVVQACNICRYVSDTLSKELGFSHPHTLRSFHNLGCMLEALGSLAESEKAYRQVLNGFECWLGPDHVDTLMSAYNLGCVLHAQNKLDEAEPVYRRVLEGLEHVIGPTHADTLGSVYSLACLLQAQGRLPEAEALYRRELEGCVATKGKSHEDTIWSEQNLARFLERKRAIDDGLLGQDCKHCGEPKARRRVTRDLQLPLHEQELHVGVHGGVFFGGAESVSCPSPPPFGHGIMAPGSDCGAEGETEGSEFRDSSAFQDSFFV